MGLLTFQDDELERVAGLMAHKFGVVVKMGGGCYTDGKAITLPQLSAVEMADPEVLGLVRHFLDHEVGHIVGNTEIDLAYEIRDTKGEAYFGILNALEDVRCEEIMEAKLVGCGVNFRAGWRSLDRSIMATLDPAAAIPLLKQAGYLVYAWGRRKTPNPKFFDPAVAKQMEPIRHKVESIPSWAGKTRDLLPLVDEIFAILKQATEDQPPPQQETQPNEKQKPKSRVGSDDKADGKGSQQGSDGSGNEPDQTAGKEVAGTAEGEAGQEQGKSDDGQQEQQGTVAADAGADSGNSGDGSGSKDGSGSGGQDGSRPKPDAASDAGDGASDGSDTEADGGGSGSPNEAGPDSGVGADGSDSGVGGDSEGGVSGDGPSGAGTGGGAGDSRLTKRKYDPSELTQPTEELHKSLAKAVEAARDAVEAKPEAAKANGVGFDLLSHLVVSRDQLPTVPFRTPCDKNVEKIWRDMVDKAGGAVRQRLMQLFLSEANVGWMALQQRGRPDPRQLASLVSGLNDRVLRSRIDEAALDTACGLVLDLSGSMIEGGREVLDEKRNVGKKWHTQAVAAALFCRTLESAGHKSAVWGFTCQDAPECGKGGWNLRGSCVLKEAKGFNESFAETAGRIRKLSSQCSGGTPLAEAILSGAINMMKRTERRRLLIVYTDGDSGSSRPFSYYSKGDVYDYHRDLCKSIERRGIEVLLVGIQELGVTLLHDRNVVVYDLADLPKTTINELTKALQPGRHIAKL